MASKTNVSYKAQFCREYFYQLKGFIENFSLNKNNLGMEFLLEVYNDVPERKKYCRWDNTVKVEEKDLMLAIEEFYSITQASETLQEQRERIFKGLMDPNTTDDMLKSVLVDQQTMQAILYYFGVSGIRKVSNKKKESQDIEDLIQGFKLFANDAAYTRSEGKNFNIFFYSQALHLFQQLRNDPAHKLFKKSVPQRKIAFQYVAFMYIGLTYLLRQTWKLRENTLGRHTKTDSFLNFSMPSQPMKIAIATDDENDRIFGYEFTPDLSNPSQKDANKIAPTNRVDNLEVSVRKYQSFKLSVTYGKPDDFKTVTFGEDGDKMLIYYYWTPTFEIHLPKVSELKPGLTNTGSADIDDKVAKLFENANKQQDFAIRSAMIKAANDFMNSLAPRLDEIKKLNENAITLSEQQEVHRRQLIEKVNQSLSTQLSKNEEYLRNILSNTKTALEEINGLKEHVKALNETQSDNQKEIWERLDQIAEAQKHLNIEAQNLYSSSYHDLDLKNPHKLKSDKTSFWLKHIPAFIILIFAFVVLIRSISNDYSLFFLENKLMSYALPVLLTVISFFSIWVAYNTTVSNRSAIIKPFTCYIGWGLPILTVLFFLFAIIAIPNKTIQSLAANYDFFTTHDEGDNAKAVKLMEDYLEDKQPLDDENLRIQVAAYYLSKNDKEKADNIVSPLLSNMAKYRKGVLDVAKNYFICGYYLKTWEILNGKNGHKGYKSFFGDSIPAVAALEGAILAFGLDRMEEYHRGDSLLSYAAQMGDLIAKYYKGRLYSNKLYMKWSDNKAYKNGSFVETISIRNYDLIDAIENLQDASCIKEAALELADLYADLNMNDSAEFYYQKAISISKERYGEAFFHLGRLYDKIGKDSREVLQKALENNCREVMVYNATKENDPKAIIAYYKEPGFPNDYQEYRYLHPLSLAYVQSDLPHKLDSALAILQHKHPQGGFDMTFVKGLELLLLSKDSITSEVGMDSLRKSAHKGCLYADMICTYDSLLALIVAKEKENVNKFSINPSRLLELGKEINYSYFLYALLLKETPGIGKQDRDNADYYAQRTVQYDHPAGNLLFHIMPLSACNAIEELIHKFIPKYNVWSKKQEFGKYGIDWKDEDFIELKRLQKKIFFSLRNAPSQISKSAFMHFGLQIDQIVYRIENKGKDYPENRLHFWTDIAIANHDFDNECFLLTQYVSKVSKINMGDGVVKVGNYSPGDLPWVKALIEASLRDVKKESQETSFFIPSLALTSHSIEESFVDYITKEWGNSPFQSKLLEINDFDWDYSPRYTYIPYFNAPFVEVLLYECSTFLDGNVLIETKDGKKMRYWEAAGREKGQYVLFD